MLGVHLLSCVLGGDEGVIVADIIAPTFQSGVADVATPDVVKITFSEDIYSPLNDYAAGFTIKVNTVAATISSAVRQSNQAIIFFTLSVPLIDTDVITIDYSSATGDIEDEAGTPNALATFTGSSVTNNVTGYMKEQDGTPMLEQDGTYMLE